MARSFEKLIAFLQKRQTRFWYASVILVSTFFLAKLVNMLIAHIFFPISIEMPSSPDRRPRAIQRPNIERHIISRNIFDSTAHEQFDEPKDDKWNEDELQPTTIPAELLGTIVFETARYSVALIRNPDKNETKYYAVGDALHDATLRRIERHRVILERQGRLETLKLQEAESTFESARVSPRRQRSPRDRNRNDEASDEVAFDEISPGRFMVPRGVVDDVLSDFSSVLRDARVIPANDADGFRIINIQPDSIYDQLGLADDDIIKSVNNQSLNSPEQAMGMFNALRHEDTISIDIVRNGSELNYTYEIR